MAVPLNPFIGKPLTVERIRYVVSYDPLTGNFYRLVPSGRQTVGPCTRNPVRSGYKIAIDGKEYFAHRLAWFYMYGEWPPEIDHIDGDNKNNCLENLRTATHSQNMQNKSKKSRAASGLIGVHKTRSPDIWSAKIMANGKTIALGTFRSKELAHEAYLRAKRKYHSFQPEFNR